MNDLLKKDLEKELLGVVPLDHMTTVQYIYERLIKKVPNLQPPILERTSRGTVQLKWDNGWHYLDIDILSDGTFVWFYRDRKAVPNLVAGGKGEFEVPNDLAAHLFCLIAYNVV